MTKQEYDRFKELIIEYEHLDSQLKQITNIQNFIKNNPTYNRFSLSLADLTSVKDPCVFFHSVDMFQKMLESLYEDIRQRIEAL